MIENKDYRICIGDELDEKWTTYFSPMDFQRKDNETILFGEIHDQAELFGVLLKIRDLGLHLSSVNLEGPKYRGRFRGMMSCIMIM